MASIQNRLNCQERLWLNSAFIHLKQYAVKLVRLDCFHVKAMLNSQQALLKTATEDLPTQIKSIKQAICCDLWRLISSGALIIKHLFFHYFETSVFQRGEAKPTKRHSPVCAIRMVGQTGEEVPPPPQLFSSTPPRGPIILAWSHFAGADVVSSACQNSNPEEQRQRHKRTQSSLESFAPPHPTVSVRHNQRG